MRHFISNIVCGVVPNKTLRDKLRVIIRYTPQVQQDIKYVRNWAKNMARCDIKTRVGYGCKNFIVILNDKYVFKFPLMNDGKEIAMREKRIVDAFHDISPIKIPRMQVTEFNNRAVRIYEFARGKLLTDVDASVVARHREHIAKQIANFLWVVGKSDPREIRDLKPNPNDKPGYLMGWFQGDIWQNFMLDTKTMNITFFIDWEEAAWMDFRTSLRVASHNWDKFGYRGIIVDLLAEYSKLYFQDV